MTDIKPRPKLQKARQLHSRIFAVALIALLLVSTPAIGHGTWLHLAMVLMGHVLVVLGTFARMLCTAYIGGRKNDVIVADGPFSVVRNPLYLFSLVAATGIALQSGMISVLLIMLVGFWLYYPHVVAREEAFLADKFGEDYEAYRRRVPRWVPNMALWKDVEHLQVKPQFMRNAIKDCWVFFMPLPIYKLIDFFHDHAILPVWLTLP